MHLDPTSAQTFIEGYQHILSAIHSLQGLKRAGTPHDRMIEARARLDRESELLDEALEMLADRRGIQVDDKVVSAVRTLNLDRWVYLRDLRHHTIILHPDGVVGYGVVGLTQPIRELTGGPGWLFKAGLMAYEGRYICDGLLCECVALGPNLRAELNKAYKSLKDTGAFHVVPRRGFAPPIEVPHPAPPRKTALAKTAEGKLGFTALQGQYLAFIHAYTTLQGQPPAERDLQIFFGVTPPVVHQMIVGLAAKGFLHREAGKARTMRVLLPPEELPILTRPSRPGGIQH